MKRYPLLVLLGLAVTLMAGCPYAAYVANPTTLEATFQTSAGEFVVELDVDSAPITVANFAQYAEEDFYDGTIFHRVVPDFIIQGGGLTPDLVPKDTHAPIANESFNGRSNTRGTIAMARTGDPNSATAQFYINVKDNVELDAVPGQYGYTVFGDVISGMDVVDAIAAVPTTERDVYAEVPIEDIIIQDVRLQTVIADGLELTEEGQAYVESQVYRTLNVGRNLLVQFIGLMLYSP